MSNSYLTPNMSLVIPVPGTDPGPDWANNLNASLTIIDSHNHTPGDGVQVPSDGININGDLSFNDAYNLTDARSVRLFENANPIAGISDLACIYSSGVDLYYNDGNGTQIRMTESGVVSGTPASYVAPTSQNFTSGSGTYSLPSSPRSPLYIRVRITGGGGGGAGSGASAGGGGSGGTGGNSSFGTSLLVAHGGVGGTAPNGGADGGAGGVATVAAGPIGLPFSGSDGSPGFFQNSTTNNLGGGSGGASAFGGSGGGGGDNDIAGSAGKTNTGSGGGGAGINALSNSTTGSGGGSGGFIDVIIASPLGSYAYAVGAGGTAGTAGSSGAAGGGGAAGVIIVEEYYQ